MQQPAEEEPPADLQEVEEQEKGKQEEEETQLLYQPKYDVLQDKGYKVPAKRLNAIARVLLLGVYDDKHLLSQFRGMRYLIQCILEFTEQFNAHYWYKFVTAHSADDGQFLPSGNRSPDADSTELGEQYFVDMFAVQFPKPSGININMMPFVMSMDFEQTKLPKSLRAYHQHLIDKCLWKDCSQEDEICYLTIQESFVEEGHTQRRPGLHVETVGKIPVDSNAKQEEELEYLRGDGRCALRQHYNPPVGWGFGSYRKENEPRDGIYMASNVAESCQAWNCKVRQVEDRDVVGHLGDIEHLRGTLQNKEMSQYRMVMQENRMYWLTDRTPHEALPMKESEYRQFFRLVTKNVSVWYEQHSTANPNGVVPNPEVTTIIKGNKFDGTCTAGTIQADEAGSSGTCKNCLIL